MERNLISKQSHWSATKCSRLCKFYIMRDTLIETWNPKTWWFATTVTRSNWLISDCLTMCRQNDRLHWLETWGMPLEMHILVFPHPKTTCRSLFIVYTTSSMVFYHGRTLQMHKFKFRSKDGSIHQKRSKWRLFYKKRIDFYRLSSFQQPKTK